MRVWLMVTLFLAVLAAAPAVAGPAPAGPSCVVLTDARGDNSYTVPAAGAGDAALDVLSASLRSDGQTLHAAIRVADLATPLIGSRSWSLQFGTEGYGYDLHALQAVDGVSFTAYGPGGDTDMPSLGNVTGRFDVSASVILINVPLKQLHVDPRARFLDFGALAGEGIGTTEKGNVGAQDTTVIADEASGHRTYRLDRGCR